MASRRPSTPELAAPPTATPGGMQTPASKTARKRVGRVVPAAGVAAALVAGAAAYGLVAGSGHPQAADLSADMALPGNLSSATHAGVGVDSAASTMIRSAATTGRPAASASAKPQASRSTQAAAKAKAAPSATRPGTAAAQGRVHRPLDRPARDRRPNAGRDDAELQPVGWPAPGQRHRDRHLPARARLQRQRGGRHRGQHVPGVQGQPGVRGHGRRRPHRLHPAAGRLRHRQPGAPTCRRSSRRC